MNEAPFEPAPQPRYDFLDWLRVIAIFALLFFHTGMVFVGWGWHVENPQVIEALAAPMDIVHRLRMPLLFVVAGAGLWFALGRRTGIQMVRERTLKLALPAVTGMFLIVPPQIYLERLFRDQWQGGYVEFVMHRVLSFQPYPHGDFSWHHLWFIVYLYVYVLLLAPLLVWWRRRGTTLRPGAWIYALSLPLAANEAVLKPVFPESHNLVSDWYVFNHYLLLTWFGFMLASLANGWDWLAAQRRGALLWALALLVGGLTMFELGLAARDTVFDALLASVFTWLSILAFLGYGRRYLSFESALLRWAREASYPVYILHQTIIVAVAYALLPAPWQPWIKYWVILVATLLGCILLFEVIRRFSITRVAFGMKKAAASALPRQQVLAADPP